MPAHVQSCPRQPSLPAHIHSCMRDDSRVLQIRGTPMARSWCPTLDWRASSPAHTSQCGMPGNDSSSPLSPASAYCLPPSIPLLCPWAVFSCYCELATCLLLGNPILKLLCLQREPTACPFLYYTYRCTCYFAVYYFFCSSRPFLDTALSSS